MTSEIVEKRCDSALSLFSSLRQDLDLHKSIDNMIEICFNAIKAGNKLFFIGNGGSASITQHLVAEIVTGEYPCEAFSLTADSAVITSLSNDYNYDQVFVRQLRSLGKPGDVLLSFSTSGTSKNILNAVELANQTGMPTLSFSGIQKSPLYEISELCLYFKTCSVNRLQEIHLFIGHIVFEMISEKFKNEFPYG